MTQQIASNYQDRIELNTVNSKGSNGLDKGIFDNIFSTVYNKNSKPELNIKSNLAQPQADHRLSNKHKAKDTNLAHKQAEIKEAQEQEEEKRRAEDKKLEQQEINAQLEASLQALALLDKARLDDLETENSELIAQKSAQLMHINKEESVALKDATAALKFLQQHASDLKTEQQALKQAQNLELNELTQISSDKLKQILTQLEQQKNLKAEINGNLQKTLDLDAMARELNVSGMALKEQIMQDEAQSEASTLNVLKNRENIIANSKATEQFKLQNEHNAKTSESNLKLALNNLKAAMRGIVGNYLKDDAAHDLDSHQENFDFKSLANTKSNDSFSNIGFKQELQQETLKAPESGKTTMTLHSNNAQKNAQEIADKVMAMAAKNLKTLEISLDPKDLGKMKLSFALDESNDALSVSIAASSQVTKDMLEQSVNKLRDMLANEQVQVNAEILDLNDEARDQGQGQQQEQQSQPQEEGILFAQDEVEEEEITKPTTSTASGFSALA